MENRMTKTLSIIALVACLCLTAVAQTTNAPPATTPSAWNVGVGIEANTYQAPVWVPFIHVDA